MHEIAVEATRNNAAWCDIVCRAHGLPTSYCAEAWISLRRSPPFYPDAITMVESVPGSWLLDRVDRSAGCSVKDSFASLDLSGDGFRVLFEAEWLYAPAVAGTEDDGLRWIQVRTQEDLASWAAAHGGGDVFRPTMLDDPAVVILSACDTDGTVEAGVVGNRSGSVIGISNVFAAGDRDRVWASAARAVADRFPGLPLVGYEHGDDLTAAHRAGFRSVGPLRVWLKD
jgi:hypothetical protein